MILRQAPDESGLPPNVEGTVITVGTFDGVHLGHRQLVTRLVARAAETGLRSVLVTFDPHPLEVVNPAAAPQLLTLPDERTELLAATGIDYVAIVPFTRNLQRYEPDAFVDVVLTQGLRMRELLIGYDHGFGRRREGDVEMLQTLGDERGFRVEVVAPVSLGDGRPVSSTAVRRAVAGGDLSGAARALGRPYSVSGRVMHGDQRGRSIGFPTINLGAPSPRKLLPPDGVYAVRAHTPSGAFGGMMNLGGRPTFGDTQTSLEAHLFDTSGHWYGARVRIDFISRIRDTMRFSGPDALREQLRRDEESARRALPSPSRSGYP